MKNFELISLLFDLLTAFSGITIGILFITLKIKNQKGNIYLALFVLSLSLGFIEDLFEDENLGILSDNIRIVIETDFFIMPSIFLYALTVARKNISYAWLLLYLPGILMNIIGFSDSEGEEIIQGLAFVLLNFSLLFFSFRVLNRFKKKLKSYYSYIEDKNISWVKTIVITTLIIHFYILFEGVLIMVFDNRYLEVFLELILSMLTFFAVYWVGYNGFQQIGYINDVSEAVALIEIPEEENEDNNSQPQNIENVNLEKYKRCCEQILKEKYFTNPNLTLKLLSGFLFIKERELSELINSCAKSNFHGFINKFRVEEFKKLLSSDKVVHYSILGLAKDAGFSSKSTFYKVFKEVEGVTPSEYKNGLRSPNTCSRTC
ncbi:AraC family transcriptional regulator [uncultured Tenacibaculum sp.]|uniref:helix-turn-helix domain-containing protein n=1 Tax=uncultured Tenacibaculum sp. TaxID=174713 RepID=UPI0026088584|nr:AraC family transcriptional regulator [uncultured Tenacibaculum sp.]